MSCNSISTMKTWTHNFIFLIMFSLVMPLWLLRLGANVES